ncbi:MAG: hypothetical protein ABH863_04510, partial [Candidatus Micrarchaeota archaeon]
MQNGSVIELKKYIPSSAMLLALLFAASYASAGTSFNSVYVLPSGTTAGGSSSFNITIGVSENYTNMTNITVVFPSGFDVSSASASAIANISSGGNTSISGQNVSYEFTPIQVNASQNISLSISGIVNTNATGTYTLSAAAFNGTSIENLTEGGASNPFSIWPSTVASIRAYFMANTSIAGINYTINFTSLDRYGNPANDTYNFSVSDSQALLAANGSANGTQLNFSLRTAGVVTVTATSASNASATNSTAVQVSASTAALVHAYYSMPLAVAGVNFSGNFSSTDAYGNALADTYNFTSTDTNSTLPANSSDNSTNYNFSLGTDGIANITAISQSNSSSAFNLTTFFVNFDHAATVQVVLSAESSIANGTIYANISSLSSNGTLLNDYYTFSSSDPLAVLPDNGATNGSVSIMLITAGSITFTVTSMSNSSALNATTFLVNASTVTTITISPLSSSVAFGSTRQYTATLKDVFGNTNSTVTANFNVSENTGGGTIDANGLFTPSSVGTVNVSANFTNLWNSTILTITAAPTPTPTTNSQDTSSNPGLTPPPSLATPTPAPRVLPTPTPAPTPSKAAIIVDTPTPTPVPYKADSEAQISAAYKEIADSKGKGYDTSEIEQLIATAKNFASKGDYEKALASARLAREKLAEMLKGGSPTTSPTDFVNRKGEFNWMLIFLIVFVA